MNISKSLLTRSLFYFPLLLLTIFLSQQNMFSISASTNTSTHHVLTYQANTYSKVAQYSGLGEVNNWAVAPGSAGQKQQVYISYKYYNGSFDLVEADPYTSNFSVHHSPIAGEWGANAEVTGPDGNIYLGTLPHAHWVRYSPRTNKMTDLGSASSTETYLWDITIGSDHKIYGVTYPHAKLVRLDPITGKSTDLGSMDKTQQYARYIAASHNGFLYIGIGSAKTTVVAYNIKTKSHKAILPYKRAGFAVVYQSVDNNVYAELPDHTYYRFSGWTATQIPASSLSKFKPAGTLSDGSVIDVLKNQITVNQPNGHSISHTFNYAGEKVNLFRLALGPDGNIYGSTILPAYLISLNITQTSSTNPPPITTIDSLIYAEVYSFVSDKKKLYMAGYAYKEALATFDPSQPVTQEGNPNPAYNPGYLYPDWRPDAMIQASDTTLYIGAIAGYGKLGGPLVRWNTATNATQAWNNVITNQSIFSLTMANGKVIGGTSIYGGPGSTPTQHNAKLFVWNPVTNHKDYETIPVSGATYISNLITAPDGLVYGFANSTLFTFNPVTRKITRTGYSLPANTAVYSLYDNIAIGSNGNIWGLATTGVYTINRATNKVTIFPFSKKITGGFALVRDKVNGDRIYFSSGSSIYMFQ